MTTQPFEDTFDRITLQINEFDIELEILSLLE